MKTERSHPRGRWRKTGKSRDGFDMYVFAVGAGRFCTAVITYNQWKRKVHRLTFPGADLNSCWFLSKTLLEVQEFAEEACERALRGALRELDA